jgi:hypothetical protein
MISPKPIRRWFRPTPGRMIAGLFVVEAFLFLSDRFRWFGFGGHKGWAVLIALASVVAVVVLVVSWTALAAVFRWRMQFTIRSLLALTFAASLALSWLVTEINRAKDQKALVGAITELGGRVEYDPEAITSIFQSARPAALALLTKPLGDDFFADVDYVGLSGSQVTDASLKRIDFKRLPQLHRIELGETELTDAGLAFLEEATQLEVFRVRYYRTFNDAGLTHLKGLTRLQELVLADTQVTDAGLENLKGLTQLQQLHLGGTQVTDAGLAHLRGLTRLQDLTLCFNRITGSGLTHLKGLTQLQGLCLDATMVNDAGSVNLKALRQVPSLMLGSTKITDAALVNLEGLTKLRCLDLSENKITDAGLVHLKWLTELEVVNLGYTKVTDEGAWELRRALPKCKVLHVGRFPDPEEDERQRGRASDVGNIGKPEPDLTPLPGTGPVFGPH